MGKFKIFLLIFVFIGFIYSQSKIVISELMFNPDGNNTEFIELFNSSTDSVDISKYTLVYYNSKADELIKYSQHNKIPPLSYALIFEGDYDFNDSFYNLDSNTIILILKDNAFGTNGMANTTNREIVLYDENSNIIDRYTYTANNDKGFSDERIDLFNNLENNWTNSTVYNGTPGKKNSVYKNQFDFEIKLIGTNPKSINSLKPFYLSFAVDNKGTLISNNLMIRLGYDENKDEIIQDDEIISFKYYQPTNINFPFIDSIEVKYFKAGSNKFIIELVSKDDENILNNKDVFTLNVYPPVCDYNDLVINEVMYAPDSGLPEWIELFNKSNKNINLNGMYIYDNSSNIKIRKDLILEPEEYLIITTEESLISHYNIKSKYIIAALPTLNNNGDKVILRDSLFNTIDSLDYSFMTSYKSGYSIERIDIDKLTNDKTNWKIPDANIKCSPGQINSVSKKNYDLGISKITYTPQYPKSNDIITLEVVLKNYGVKENFGNLQLVVNGTSEYSSDIVYINPNDSLILKLPLIEKVNNGLNLKINFDVSNDENQLNNIYEINLFPSYKNKSLIINEIMFLPEGGEPEWVELINVSETPINLNNFIVRDLLTTPKTSNFKKKDVILEPNEYMVISKDTSIVNYHSVIDSKIIICDLPILNNDIDAVIIKDSYGITIDSVYYNNKNYKTGYSIEKINLFSNEINNWNSSIDIEKSSPGRKNSLSPKDYDLSLTDISYTPKRLSINDKFQINGKIKNLGSKDIDSFTIRLFEENNIIEEKEYTNFKSKDSLIYIYNNLTYTDSLTYTIEVISKTDEDLTNNKKSIKMLKGLPAKALLFNELMINSTNQPEWIEIYNNTNSEINLKNISINNIRSKISSQIRTKDEFISANSYAVLTNGNISNENIKILKCNIGNLLETEGNLILTDINGVTIDSLYYKNFATQANYSIERISFIDSTTSKNNWKESVAELGHTMGFANSVTNIPAYNFNDLVITEIMFDPEDYNSEFIELYNKSNKNIDLTGWTFERSKKYKYNLTTNKVILLPNEYFLIASDSNFLNIYNTFEKKYSVSNKSFILLNTKDDLRIYDAKNNIIDSVFYDKQFHNPNFVNTKNRSLEKINYNLSGYLSTNWSSSTVNMGATPLEKNSIFLEDKQINEELVLSPNPFSPDNDGFEDYLSINYKLNSSSNQISIKIFNRVGRLVKTLLNNYSSGSENSIIFDGRDDNGDYLNTGVYIMLFEAYLNDTQKNVSIKKPFVVVKR